MNSIATYNGGFIEEAYSFFKDESSVFDKFRFGCAILFDGVVDVSWAEPYRVEVGELQDTVVLNRSVVGPDVTPEDIIMCGSDKLMRTTTSRTGSAILSAA